MQKNLILSAAAIVAVVIGILAFAARDQRELSRSDARAPGAAAEGAISSLAAAPANTAHSSATRAPDAAAAPSSAAASRDAASSARGAAAAREAAPSAREPADGTARARPGPPEFEKKYETFSTEDLKHTFDALAALLADQRDKLAPDDIAAMEEEIAWVKAKAYP
jgi:hypothetical protein